jgi:hypothetical protein
MVERPAALDVHKAQMTACVRMPAGRDGRSHEIAEFATSVRGLLPLHDRLCAHHVTPVGHGGYRCLLEASLGGS